MACPLCDDVCVCPPETQPAGARSSRPRFEPDLPISAPGRSVSPARLLVDPEAYDVSEQQFSASLEAGTGGIPRPRFVPDAVAEDAVPELAAEPAAATALDEPVTQLFSGTRAAAEEKAAGENRIVMAEEGPPAEGGASPVAESAIPPEESGTRGMAANPALDDSAAQLDPTFWKQEVAARVNSYRARRKLKGPKFPSLPLQFEPSKPGHGFAMEPAVLASALAIQLEEPEELAAPLHETPSGGAGRPLAVEWPKIIEFPRLAVAPPTPLEELAEPVLDRPRILEAPEVVPPAPALGGITLDPQDEDATARPGFEVPLQTVSLERRMLAAAVDGVIVLAVCAGSGFIFFKLTRVVPPVQQWSGLAAGGGFLLWSLYQYLHLVYTGTTPGLRLTRLQLRRFDGSPAHRRIRRWRVLAGILSGLSLGLGYVWCFLDEDKLCWHDRITRTHLRL